MRFDAADPGALLAVLSKYVVLTRMHPGCRNIDLCASVTHPGRYLLIQKWDNARRSAPLRQRGHGGDGAQLRRPAVRASRHRPVGRPQRARPALILRSVSGHVRTLDARPVSFPQQTHRRALHVQSHPQREGRSRSCPLRLGRARSGALPPRSAPSTTARSAAGSPSDVMTIAARPPPPACSWCCCSPRQRRLGHGSQPRRRASPASRRWPSGGMLVGFVCAIVVSFKPRWPRSSAPSMRWPMGFFLGVISKAYNNFQGHRRAGHRCHAGRVRR
jgi:hypothetical protein